MVSNSVSYLLFLNILPLKVCFLHHRHHLTWEPVKNVETHPPLPGPVDSESTCLTGLPGELIHTKVREAVFRGFCCSLSDLDASSRALHHSFLFPSRGKSSAQAVRWAGSEPHLSAGRVTVC